MKRRVSVSLDEELVAELERGDGTVSAQVNDAVRAELARRQRRRQLDALCEELVQRFGPPDEARVQQFMEQLT